MSSFGGGGRSGGRGRGRGRSGGRSSGRSSGSYQHGDNNQAPGGAAPKMKPCSNFTTSGACQHGNSCQFHHVVQLHASIDATSAVAQTNQKQQNSYNNRHNQGYNNQNQQQQKSAISSVAVWQTEDQTIKIFTGSHDGWWRLWNTGGGKFVKEFEHNMNGKVATLEVASNFLFCGYEETCSALNGTKVGGIQAWNLSNPNNPPLHFHMHPLAPYAHAGAVSIVKVVAGDKIVSGDRNGVIRVWTFQVDKFALVHTLHGHVGEITGLTAVDNMLWSCAAMDNTIRLWDLQKNGECMHVIPSGVKDKQGQGSSGGGGQSNPQSSGNTGTGHTNAITSLITFKSPAGTFVLSSSLDGRIKAWNGADGACVASESHGAGVVSMAISMDQQNNPLLMAGLETGNIMVRNLVQKNNTAAFRLLFSLSARFTAGHEGACKDIKEGPQSTFYSGGEDGKLLVWQLTGDLEL